MGQSAVDKMKFVLSMASKVPNKILSSNPNKEDVEKLSLNYKGQILWETVNDLLSEIGVEYFNDILSY